MFKNRISNPILRNILEWVLALALAFALFFIVRTFLFRLATVSGESMMPSLSDGDMVFLNRISNFFSDPQAGDVVAFPNPSNPAEYYIKRVVGVPGDVIDLINGIFYVNGQPLDDAFSVEPVLAIGNVDFPVTVEEGRFFVLGDNRNRSKDSRHIAVGNVSGDNMVGRVAFRIWPISAIGRVD